MKTRKPVPKHTLSLLNCVLQLQEKLVKLMLEKEELIKAVEESNDSYSEKAEQDIKVHVY